MSALFHAFTVNRVALLDNGQRTTPRRHRAQIISYRGDGRLRSQRSDTSCPVTRLHKGTSLSTLQIAVRDLREATTLRDHFDSVSNGWAEREQVRSPSLMLGNNADILATEVVPPSKEGGDSRTRRFPRFQETGTSFPASEKNS